MPQTDVEMAELRAENEQLRSEIDELRQELDALRREADLDACHAAGLSAQIRALIAEGDACPNRDAHPLLVRSVFVNAMTGAAMQKTMAFPLYREAFDATAREMGLDDPESLRA